MKLAIEKLVREKCKANTGFERLLSENKENVISFNRDDFHLYFKLEYISLQISIRIEEKNAYGLIFLDPIIVNSKNKGEFINFINHVNWLTMGFGHFYVDTNNDIAYAIRIPEYLIQNHIEEVGTELFGIPISLYTDIQIPLSKIAAGDWKAEIAIKYIDEILSLVKYNHPFMGKKIPHLYIKNLPFIV